MYTEDLITWLNSSYIGDFWSNLCMRYIHFKFASKLSIARVVGRNWWCIKGSAAAHFLKKMRLSCYELNIIVLGFEKTKIIFAFTYNAVNYIFDRTKALYVLFAYQRRTSTSRHNVAVALEQSREDFVVNAQELFVAVKNHIISLSSSSLLARIIKKKKTWNTM